MLQEAFDAFLFHYRCTVKRLLLTALSMALIKGQILINIY